MITESSETREKQTTEFVTTGVRHSLILESGRMLLTNKRLLLWSYLSSLCCGVLATAALGHYLGGFLKHTLAAQEIAGRVEGSYVLELLQQAGAHRAINVTPSVLSIFLFTLTNFIIAAGSLFVFQTNAAPRISVVAEAGLRYFWRFVRLTIVAAITGGLIVWLLTLARDEWLSRAGEHYVEKALFVRDSISIALIVVVVLLLRFYFDLAEAVTVQIGIGGDRRVRRGLKYAWKLVRSNFLSAFSSYILVGCVGIAIFALCLWLWLSRIAPSAVLLAFLLGQAGIAALLAGRLWQRAILSSLVVQSSAAYSLPAPPEVSPIDELPADTRVIW